MIDNATCLPSDALRMLGLPGLDIITTGRAGGELEIVVESSETLAGCPECGVVAVGNGRRDHLVRDVPHGDLPVLLVWRKRRWRCAEPACPKGTWSEAHPQIRARAVLTERAAVWAMTAVGRDWRPVAQIARQLGVGWATVMDAVRRHGQHLIDEPQRIEGVSAVGVDEHTWQHAGATRRTQYATGIVDMTAGHPARLLDVCPGRSGKACSEWLQRQSDSWRAQVAVAALDPFVGYANGLRAGLPDAVRVLDAFHVSKLANQALNEVRRRVQQEQLGHRGRKRDPLFGIRRLLTRNEQTLSDRQAAKLVAGLEAGDPDGEVEVAWRCAQKVQAIYRSTDPADGRDAAEWVIRTLPSCPIPEIARLGRTLRAWKCELLAYFNTGGASNGPTEAINLIIEKHRRIGHGYRNWDNYRLRLLLACGLDWSASRAPQIRKIKPRQTPLAA